MPMIKTPLFKLNNQYSQNYVQGSTLIPQVKTTKLTQKSKTRRSYRVHALPMIVPENFQCRTHHTKQVTRIWDVPTNKSLHKLILGHINRHQNNAIMNRKLCAIPFKAVLFVNTSIRSLNSNYNKTYYVGVGRNM